MNLSMRLDTFACASRRVFVSFFSGEDIFLKMHVKVFRDYLVWVSKVKYCLLWSLDFQMIIFAK